MLTKIVTVAAGLAAATVFADQELCGEWNSTETDEYILYSNLWGAFDDPNSSQCTGLDRVVDSTIIWHMSYSWAGTPYQVKSFANAALKFHPVQLLRVKSIPATIEYEFQHSENTIANVAFDLFTKAAIDGEVENEVMVWTAALGGALPLSTSGKPIKTATIGNFDFTLYQGMNGNMTVFSYPDKMITSFSADLKKFYDGLPKKYRINPAHYLTHVQGGAEILIGNGTLTVSKYQAAIHTTKRQ
ncbi:Glycosyl hydrolase family 12 [Phytophthora infestans]|uniref:Glycosyl hydrolase family 12 n=1 Tax=Phytophthora infestans TaxID=4787 RepID=A0A8S9U2R2_PHYIN|nr:Glycosyl hydrolase family 12 [Phytophthora infestans]